MAEEQPGIHVPKDFDLWKTADSDPDFALALTNAMAEKDPEAMSNIYVRIGRFLAFKTKGIQTLREVGFSTVDVAEEEELRQYVTDEQLNLLERALQEFAVIQELDKEGDILEKLPADVDAVAIVVERCCPGRVHAILGWVKLSYLGLARLKPMDHIKREVPSKKVRAFLRVPFSYPRVFKSALAYYYGRDPSRGEYLSFKLLRDLFSEWGPDDKVGDHEIGCVHIYSDGTFIIENPPASPPAKAVPTPLPTEVGRQSSTTPREQKDKRKEGFFKRLFG